MRREGGGRRVRLFRDLLEEIDDGGNLPLDGVSLCVGVVQPIKPDRDTGAGAKARNPSECIAA